MHESDDHDTQAEVVAFLGDAASRGLGVTGVERIETHGALVFLAGGDVYKIKRAVRYAYMDFSTLERRRLAATRELDINRGFAPDIYLGIVPITREADGRLAIGGNGAPVEWAVHMRRFPEADVLSQVAARRAIDRDLARDIADAVYDSHGAAAVDRTVDTPARLGAIIAELGAAFAEPALGFDPTVAQAFAAASRARLAAAAEVLRRRAAAGHVRRCHGDLHLANIVLWRGRPTLFDALEFDEALATIDTLYDLAFLLMDLDRRDQRGAANVVLNRALWRSQAPLDLEGLKALPLLLALRAGIRAMVLAQRAERAGPDRGREDRAAPRGYLGAALDYLSSPPPVMVAVGGLSGTGKSTLSAGLAPRLGAVPGAVLLRSDLERKALFGVAETARLPDDAYAAAVSRRVYDILQEKAQLVLAAGHAVIIDAVSLSAEERTGLRQVAASRGVPFAGLWLTAPEATLLARIGARVNDASDADVAVVRRQLGVSHDRGDWIGIDAGGPPEATLRAALAALADATSTPA